MLVCNALLNRSVTSSAGRSPPRIYSFPAQRKTPSFPHAFSATTACRNYSEYWSHQKIALTWWFYEFMGRSKFTFCVFVQNEVGEAWNRVFGELEIVQGPTARLFILVMETPGQPSSSKLLSTVIHRFFFRFCPLFRILNKNVFCSEKYTKTRKKIWTKKINIYPHPIDPKSIQNVCKSDRNRL